MIRNLSWQQHQLGEPGTEDVENFTTLMNMLDRAGIQYRVIDNEGYNGRLLIEKNGRPAVKLDCIRDHVRMDTLDWSEYTWDNSENIGRIVEEVENYLGEPEQ